MKAEETVGRRESQVSKGRDGDGGRRESQEGGDICIPMVDSC